MPNLVMPTAFSQPLDTFRLNRQKVSDLLKFDQHLLSLVQTRLQGVQDAQNKANPPFNNPRHRVDTVLQFVTNIRQNNSLATHYDTIHNQGIVLLVSYFAAALHDLYRLTFTHILSTSPPKQLLTEDFKVTIGDLIALKSDDSFSPIADLYIDKKDLSFQDMQSIQRAFTELIEFAPKRCDRMNDIILAQACRHAIVHTGEVVNRRTDVQLTKAIPRTLKPILKEGMRIAFTESEVTTAAEAMQWYLTELTTYMDETHESTTSDRQKA